ncbi:MAG: chemotaxis protein CheR, partial [Candidatus Omnitrophica bacterium]|nr:chemotaxis protein CheR [Candidatus Omnitrophota bacterium]
MAFTYFFRDMQTLEMIRDYVLPALRSSRYINIWDAGCAMGPEPYSLSIVLRENMGKMIFRNVKI